MPQIMRRAEEDNDEVFDSGFMKLLGCDEELQFEEIEEKGFFSFSFSSSSLSSMAPQMLHFDGAHEESFLSLMNRVMGSTDPCSTSPSSASDGKTRSRSTTKKVNDGRAETDGSNKRTRGGSNKGKKEKIGDRISVLHKLVSPFGKSDTATVLHEAMGYIRFLHDQVQVLSSPYLQQPSYSYQSGEEGEEIMGALKSRGLCLIPVLSAENMGGFEEQRTVFGHHCNSHNTYTSSFSNSGSKH